MSRCKHALVAAISVALACTALKAQSANMRATVPFDFHAGLAVLPAGEYFITEEGPVVILKSATSGRPASIILSNGTSSRSQPNEGRLEFDHFGSEYFLTAIWRPFDPQGRQIPKTKRQEELAKRGDVLAGISLSSTK
jgi:hypothetical protein